MARFGITIIFCLSLFWLADTASTELSLDIIYDMLSRRIDDVKRETNIIKNGLVETNSAVSKIENKIENIQANVSAAIIDLNKNMERVSESLINDKVEKVEKRSESLINDEIKNMQVISESLNTEIMKQSVTVQKMLFTEKKRLREIAEKFENKFLTLESDMKSQMILMNASLESTVDSLEQSMTGHKTQTNTSLVSMNTDLQYMMNATNQQIEVMDVVFRNMMEDSNLKIEETKSEIENQTNIKMKELKQDIQEKSIQSMEKINEVSQDILTRTSSNLQSAKSGINYRLNNAESRLSSISSKLTSLEREQESQEDKFDGQISRLSSRIAKEEARKVAFSARLTTKRSYYNKDERIVFDDVQYSYGGGYSSSTGIFTAPKSGTYLFTFNVGSRNSNSKSAHIGLMVRGYWKTSAIVKGGPDLTGGNAGIAYLSYGDKAWIETASLDDKHYIWPYRTTFNGILID